MTSFTGDSIQMKHEAIRGFSVDFNWDAFSRPAPPGLYTHAVPGDQLRWMQDLGANTIQTYCVSYNGLAWFKASRTAPVNPGLKHDFLPELVELGHAAGMRVMGYFCLAANPIYERANPNEILKESWMPVLLTQKYLDYFCAQVREAAMACEMDGFMVDWFSPPVKRNQWIPAERTLWQEIVGEEFPTADPDQPATWAYERALLERAWAHIRAAADSVRPGLIIWPNIFGVHDDKTRALYGGTRLMREADWILNEFPKTDHIQETRRHMGQNAILIQDVCGMAEHDADTLWDTVEQLGGHAYGYAKTDPVTCLPPTQVESYWPANITHAVRRDIENIAKIRNRWRNDRWIGAK